MWKPKKTITIYRGVDGLWYWTMRASNGRTTADGSEGYTRRSAAIAAVQKHQRDIRSGDVRVVILDHNIQ